jgi:hypothetical protein
MKVHVSISTIEGSGFNTRETLKLDSYEIPHLKDIIDTSYGVFEVIERIVHFDRGELFTVRLVVRDMGHYDVNRIRP